MPSQDESVEVAKQSLVAKAQAWGKSPLPPMVLATFITSLHIRPFQTLPMLFPPVLLFSTYLNLNHYTVDSAGITAAWSGLYMLMASRRRNLGLSFAGRISSRFGTRGLIRGATMGIAFANLVGCGMTYAFGKRDDEANPFE